MFEQFFRCEFFFGTLADDLDDPHGLLAMTHVSFVPFFFYLGSRFLGILTNSTCAVDNSAGTSKTFSRMYGNVVLFLPTHILLLAYGYNLLLCQAILLAIVSFCSYFLLWLFKVFFFLISLVLFYCHIDLCLLSSLHPQVILVEPPVRTLSRRHFVPSCPRALGDVWG